LGGLAMAFAGMNNFDQTNPDFLLLIDLTAR